MKLMWIHAGFFFLCVFLFSSADAKSLDILAVAQPKHSVISGVLSPASLSFNGKEIYQSGDSFEALLLNEKEVPVVEVGGLKSFYLNIEDSSIDLKWKKSNQETVPLLKIDYPSVTAMHFTDNKIVFKFNAPTKEVRLDSQKLDIAGAETEFRIENASDWLAAIHTLELSSDKKTSQIYNLDLSPYKKEILTLISWSVYSADGPFSGNMHPTAYGAGARIQYENRRSLEYIFLYSKVNYEMGFWFPGTPNEVTQSAMQFKIRYGLNPFETNPGEINYKRVTIGVQSELINYKRTSTFVTWMDGFNSDNVDAWYLQGGFFLRWEPIQYENFGMVLGVDIRVLRTMNELYGDGDGKFFGLTYRF